MDTGLIVVGLAGLGAFIFVVVNFRRKLTNLRTHKSGVVTQIIVWAAGVGGVFLFAATQFGGTAVIGGIGLDAMDAPTKFWVGLMIGSAASVVTDFKQAIDGGDSARKPELIPGQPPSPGE